jgi:alpha-glucosidase
MHQVPISDARARDPWGNNVEWLSRDGARTPMQWNGEPNAGFTHDDVEPWLPVGPGYGTINVDSELDAPDSTLNLYRRLLRVRKEHSALHLGSFLTHPATTEDVFAYRLRTSIAWRHSTPASSGSPSRRVTTTTCCSRRRDCN